MFLSLSLSYSGRPQLQSTNNLSLDEAVPAEYICIRALVNSRLDPDERASWRIEGGLGGLVCGRL
jgi:hypothetical protein